MNADIIPNLWGSISVDVVSPLAVLRNQAGRLSGLTGGLLTADVRTAVDNTGETHTFQIIAPSLKGYRFDLFLSAHARDLVYPVRVLFRPWQQADHDREFALDRYATLAPDADERDRRVEAREAATTASFIQMVGEVLTHSYTQSVISSLIARSNEGAAAPAA